MSIPAGGGELAKGAGSVGDAVGGAGKSTGNSMGQSAGFGPGGGVGSAAAEQGKGAGAPAPGGGGASAAGGNPMDLVQKSTASPLAQMGPGGTSPAGPGGGESADSSGISQQGDGAKVALGAAAAAPAAAVGAQLMFALMFLNWLKSMFFAAMAAAMNFVNMILGVVLAVGKAVVGGLMAAGGAVSAAVGGAVSAVTGAVATATVGALVVGMTVVTAVTGAGASTAQKDGALFDCSSDVVAASLSVPAPVEGADPAATQKNAEKVYSILAAWGMPDENVAGILGNWDAESGIDPTGVETIFGEPHNVGPKKKAAEAAGFDVNAVDAAYGARFPGVKLVGIGLGQWSNDRNTQLVDYAKSAGGSWSSFETQLGFMISKDSGAPVIKDMIKNPVGSPAQAAVKFHDDWERSADTSMTRREAAADKWFAQMSGWEKNQSLADSILAQSGAAVDSANDTRVATAYANCLSVKAAGLSGLKEGGLNLEEATALMATYKKEGDSVLQEAFHGGGPGDCGFGQADNCVGFSSYFMYKFTSLKQYAPGNGIDTAGSVANLTGKKTTSTPKPYSIFSMPTEMPEGHTGVILGIQGDTAIVGEASCGTAHSGTRAYTKKISEMGSWVFTDVSDILTDESLK